TNQHLIDRLFWSTTKMRRNPFSPALELSLMEKTQTRRQKRDDRRRLVNSRRECGRSSRLVVVFQKASQLVLIIQPRPEMLAHRPRVAVTQAIVESFVVGVVEALLL